jgi:hypothetical protein
MKTILLSVYFALIGHALADVVHQSEGPFNQRPVGHLTQDDLFFTQLHLFNLHDDGSHSTQMMGPNQRLPPFRAFIHFDTRFTNEVSDGRRGRWTWVWTDQDGELVLDEFGNPELLDTGTELSGGWLGRPNDASGFKLDPRGGAFGSISGVSTIRKSSGGPIKGFWIVKETRPLIIFRP